MKALPIFAATAVIALALAALLASCGQDAAPAPSPTSAPTPPPDSPAPADVDYFALSRVLDVSIKIAPADWDALRRQGRTLEDVFAEIAEKRLSEPFADI